MKAILLINLGTPDSPSVKDVQSYLREFLMDWRVMDIPFLKRLFLVCGIIAPFRALQSARVYKKVWMEKGSPLKIYGERTQGQLQKALGNECDVYFAMRYKNPNLKDVLWRMQRKSYEEIIVLPLYPQYASSSTGSSIEYLFKHMKSWQVIPHLHIISQFLDDPLFIQSLVKVARPYLEKTSYDHHIFSYHGLPERQIHKASASRYCQINDKCCSQYNTKNKYCYRSQCFQTTRLLAGELGIAQDQYTVCFQSRLGKTPWIKPYTDDVVKSLAQKGTKSILAFSPSFVADCLETTIEIGEEYKNIFMKNGGETLNLVRSLNDETTWIHCLKEMILNTSRNSRSAVSTEKS